MIRPFRFRHIILALALAAAFFAGGVSQKSMAILLPSQDLRETPKFIERVTQFGVLDDASLNLMVGDSLTERGLWDELMPGASIANRGIGSATVPIMISLLDQMPKKATAAFLMAGVNDVAAGRKADAISDDYRAMIDWLNRRRFKVHVVSTLLTSTPSWNREIELLNGNLRRYCDARNCTFINITDETSSDGLIKPDLTSDGIHLKGEGYRIWADAIKPFLEVAARQGQ